MTHGSVRRAPFPPRMGAGYIHTIPGIMRRARAVRRDVMRSRGGLIAWLNVPAVQRMLCLGAVGGVVYRADFAGLRPRIT
jgi:hypothetical protein